MLSWIKEVISVPIIHNFIFFLSRGKHYIYLKASAKSCLDCTFSRAAVCLITHTEISSWSRRRGAAPHYLNKKSKSSDSKQVQQPGIQIYRQIHSREGGQTQVRPVSQGLNWRGLRSSMQLKCRSGREQGSGPQLKCSSWAVGLTLLPRRLRASLAELALRRGSKPLGKGVHWRPRQEESSCPHRLLTCTLAVFCRVLYPRHGAGRRIWGSEAGQRAVWVTDVSEGAKFLFSSAIVPLPSALPPGPHC